MRYVVLYQVCRPLNDLRTVLRQAALSSVQWSITVGLQLLVHILLLHTTARPAARARPRASTTDPTTTPHPPSRCPSPTLRPD